MLKDIEKQNGESFFEWIRRVARFRRTTIGAIAVENRIDDGTLYFNCHNPKKMKAAIARLLSKSLEIPEEMVLDAALTEDIEGI